MEARLERAAGLGLEPEAGGGSEGQGPWSFAQPQNGHGCSGHEVRRAAQDALEYCALLSPPQSRAMSFR